MEASAPHSFCQNGAWDFIKINKKMGRGVVANIQNQQTLCVLKTQKRAGVLCMLA